MKKIDIIETLANRKSMTKKDATAIVETVLDIIKCGIRDDKEVDISNFARFYSQYKEAGTARNPKTNEIVETEAKYVPKVKFKPSFKEFVND